MIDVIRNSEKNSRITHYCIDCEHYKITRKFCTKIKSTIDYITAESSSYASKHCKYFKQRTKLGDWIE